jgi:catechol 2,3-dioxygenase-like lactoylglutathione lyase family enzyme
VGVAGLDHVVIAVSEWGRSNAFYRDVLGAEVLELDYGRYAYRLPDGRQLNVHGPGATPHPRALDPVRPGVHGVEVELGPVARTVSRGRGTSVYFRDPDGSLLELIVYE